MCLINHQLEQQQKTRCNEIGINQDLKKKKYSVQPKKDAGAQQLRPASFARRDEIEAAINDELQPPIAYAELVDQDLSSWCWVPASAGARNFRGRRQPPLLGPRRWGELTEIDVRCAERAPLPPPPALRPATPPAPRTYPDHSHRLEPPTPRLHAPLAPHPLSPFVPSCAQVLDVAH